MNYGILIYTSEFKDINIGDYIQSLAAKQFLPKEPNYLINREELNKFDKDEVKIILNGWFTHHPQNWLPSINILPFFISFHISNLAYKDMLNPESIKYLKKYEPIGCRDFDTMNKLKEQGLDAYFSGCLTLTLGKTYKSKDKNDEILFVDPYIFKSKNILFVIKNILSAIFGISFLLKLCYKINKKCSLKHLYNTILFYNQYKQCFEHEIFLKADYIKHYYPTKDFNNELGKFQLAEKLLHRYSKAKLIITSRIHCALPSTGLETPVLYVDNVQQDLSSSCRLNGLVDFFNVIENKKGKLQIKFLNKSKSIGINTIIQNPDKYATFKEQLEIKCENFIKGN